MEISDENNNHLYSIEGPLFQMGIWTTRFCTCDVCQKAFFYIKDKRAKNKIVGLVEKVLIDNFLDYFCFKVYNLKKSDLEGLFL